jgi:hypothetical protein
MSNKCLSMSLVLGKQRREFEMVSNSLASFSLEQMSKTYCIDVELSSICRHMSSLLAVYQNNYVTMSCLASSNDNNTISARHALDMQRVFKTSVQHLHEFVRVLFNTSSKTFASCEDCSTNNVRI